MKVLIYGSSGWIGGLISKILCNANDNIVHGRRVNCLGDVQDDLREHQPDNVICCVGRTYGPGNNTSDYLEGPNKLLDNISANLTAPILIAQATASANKRQIPLLYIGTGCIFEYDNDHPKGGKGFTEGNCPNFFGSSYSTVKGQTDLLMESFNHVICARMRMPILDCDHPRDFITKFVTYKKVSSNLNSMTVLSDFLPFLVACLSEKKSGIINAVNPGTIDIPTILSMHRDIRDKNHSYELMTMEEQKLILIAGRANNCLNPEKAEQWLNDLGEATRLRYGVPTKFRNIVCRVEEILITRETISNSIKRNRKCKLIILNFEPKGDQGR